MKKHLLPFVLAMFSVVFAFAQQPVNAPQKFNANVIFNDSTYGNLSKVPVTTFEDTVRITRGAGNGKVLASDANGNAYWTNVVLVDTFSGTPVFPSGIKTDTIFTTDFNGTGYVLQLVNDTTGVFKPLVFTNGLTKTGDTTRLGGSIAIGTEIYHWFGDSVKYSNKIDNPTGDLATVEWRYDDVENGRNAVINLWHSEVFGLFAAEMSVFDTAANAGSGINVSEAGAGTKWIVSSNVAEVAYGAESWTEREEVNFFITDNSVAHDIGRIDLHCDSLLTPGNEWIRNYIVDLETYSGTPNHGIQQIYMDSSSIRLQYKASHGSYVYADTTAPTSVEIDEAFKIIKPESLGTVFWVDKNGKTTATDFAVVDGTEGTGKVLTSDASGNATWSASSTTSLDSATIYALAPANGTQYYCNNCTGNGITGRIVAFIGAAWRRLTFED